MKPAALIDRDGTININTHHLNRVEDLQLIPGAGEAIAHLNSADYPVIIITNQSVIARGLLTEIGLTEIHEELKRQLSAYNASIDAIYHCPHHPDFGDGAICDCRKPAPGMIFQAANEHNIDLACSIMIGDSLTDVEAGWNAGCRGALVRTGSGENVLGKIDDNTRDRIDYIGDDLSDVVNWILSNE
jgi:D-glycero-D-manno-heptose 1,7-bisphosphate phosphatase